MKELKFEEIESSHTLSGVGEGGGGVMKEIKFEEIESSHTLSGVGEGGVQGRGKWRGCTLYILLCCQIHYSQMVGQEQTRVLGFGCGIK